MRRGLRRCPAPICTICGDPARPVADDLKAISVCGHVFHGFCLHRWMNERRQGGNNLSCPICKQPFGSDRSLQRLFFESQNGGAAFGSELEGSAEEEVRGLEERLSSFVAMFQNQEERIRQLSDELYMWKAKLEREEVRKEEMLKENECMQRMLQMKMEELFRKSMECTELQGTISVMDKDLTVLKLYEGLITDLDLGEEEMTELASVAHGMKHEDAMYVLKRSLALRNKRYKELKFQSNLITREAKRTLKKYVRAQEKIERLKRRLEELENTAQAIPKVRRASKKDYLLS